jgi:PilZ domain
VGDPAFRSASGSAPAAVLSHSPRGLRTDLFGNRQYFAKRLVHAEPRAVEAGELLSLSVQIPTDISGSYRCYFHCTGVVVHEPPLSLDGVGYGVKFEGMLSARRLSSDPTEGIFKSGHSAEDFHEKRRNVRHALRLAASFRAPDVFPGIEMPAETLNISRYGVLLATPVMLKVSSPLSLLLNGGAPVLEGNISGERLKARVVHRSKLPNGSLAYGVEIDQALPPIRVHHRTDAEVPIAWG